MGQDLSSALGGFRNMVMIYLLVMIYLVHLISSFYPTIKKTLFLDNGICLENGISVIYNFTYYLRIVYAKLVTEWKLCRVSTYLPNLEALCSEHIWNTCSATTTSNLRLRPSGG